MKNIFLIVFLLSVIAAAQEPYKIPFNSTGNSIELAVVNTSGEALKEITVSAEQLPAYIKVDNIKTEIPELKAGEETTALYTFSVAKDAPIKKEIELNFIIKNKAGHEWSKQISVTVTPPDKYELFQNYPNPFNPVTTISWQLPEASKVELKIFDILGEEVAILKNEIQEAGYYKVEWNPEEKASGVYIYVLHTKSGEKENFFRKKMMVLK